MTTKDYLIVFAMINASIVPILIALSDIAKSSTTKGNGLGERVEGAMLATGAFFWLSVIGVIVLSLVGV